MSASTVTSAEPHAQVYRGFHILDQDGWFYAIPEHLLPVDWNRWRDLLQHPAVMAAPSRTNLEMLIDDFDATQLHQEPLGSFEGYALVRFQHRVYAIPEGQGAVDLSDPQQRNHPSIFEGSSVAELQERIRSACTARPVEFAGWLPAFLLFGNCGLHPQFAHTEKSPTGYRFVRSGWIAPDPPAPAPRPRRWLNKLKRLGVLTLRAVDQGLRCAGMLAWDVLRTNPVRTTRVVSAAARLYRRFRRGGGSIVSSLRYLRTRQFRSQLLLPDRPGLVFLTSVPFTFGQHPWVIEIEDSTTLFFPGLHNGQTAGVNPRQLPFWPLVRTQLEDPACRAIITHIRSTAKTLPVLFDSEIVAAKTFHLPLGVRLPDRPVDQRDDSVLHLLFTNSWHQKIVGFPLRGGLDVLEAYSIVRRRYPHLRLTMRTSLPPLIDRHHRMIEEGWVRIISRFLPREEMEALQQQSHIYLLPAARIHIVSLLQAMSYGQAVVVSDGWGFEEYIDNERNGLVIPGRAGKVTWMDEQAGLLREDYHSMYKPDPHIVARLVDSISRLIEDRQLRCRLAANARADVETRYSLTRWNEGLRTIFDQVYPKE